MLVIAKGLSFLGLNLVIGAGTMFSFLLSNTNPKTKSRLRIGKQLGISFVIAGGLLELLGLYTLLPNSLAASQKWTYIRSSQLDLFFLIKCFWLAIAACFVLNDKLELWKQRSVFVVFLFGLLVSFSLSSSFVGLNSFIVSFVHLLAGVLWAGAVLYTAVLPMWSDPSKQQEIYRLMKRISFIGISSVALMVLTGLYSASRHVGSTEVLLSSQYGRVLMFKGVLVLNTLALAFANRMVVLPVLKSKGLSEKLAQFVQIEAVILILILFATGLLTNSPLLPLDHGHLEGLGSLDIRGGVLEKSMF